MKKNTRNNKKNTKKNILRDYPDLGPQMVKMAKKAMAIIRANFGNMQAKAKVGYDGKNNDCVTIADHLAQAMYLREIRRHFPTFGVLAEEAELAIPCTDQKYDAYFTVDPLDGTKAFARKQSHGVGTMIALVEGGKIVAVVIGDVNTGEVYWYADTKARGEVIREKFGRDYNLQPATDKKLDKQYAFLLDHPREQPDVMQKMIMPHPNSGGLFKDFEIGSGSIGLRFARLWKGEVGAIFLCPTYDTPWDLMPVVGISQRLGFRFLRLTPANGKFLEFKPELVKKITHAPYATLIIHEKHMAELNQWMRKHK